MTNQNNNVYFWLGEQGKLFELSDVEFVQEQKKWQGPRPADYIEGL